MCGGKSAVYMLNSVNSFKLTLYGCVVFVCCVGITYSIILNSVYFNGAHIDCYSDSSRVGSHLFQPLCYGVI